jgi:YggT family protein
MLSLFTEAFRYIVQNLFELYILLVSLQIIFHWVKVSRTNPILLLIARVTAPPLRPIYSLVPSVNGIDFAAIALLSALSMLKISILFWLNTHILPPMPSLIVLAFGGILKQFIDIFFFIIMMFSLMSWFNPVTSSAIVEIIVKISEPLLRPTRGLWLNISGIDFSPMVVALVLQLVNIRIVAPLIRIGFDLMKTGLI